MAALVGCPEIVQGFVMPEAFGVSEYANENAVPAARHCGMGRRRIAQGTPWPGRLPRTPEDTRAEGWAGRRSAHMTGDFGKNKREPSPWIEQGVSLSRRQTQRLRPVRTSEVEAPPGLLRAVVE